MNELIDTTEMYLRTIYDLEEEGVLPLRARIAERLQQSGPTVSQTVARMERDGLVIVANDRHLELTDQGRELAVAVMRKHRLAERLLVDVIGLEWEQVHTEACRWEHVMSEAVERKLIALLGHPTTSPYGNPIPGLDRLGEFTSISAADPELRPLDDIAREGGGVVEIHRIAEHVQADETLMAKLKLADVLPGNTVRISGVGKGGEIDVQGENESVTASAAILHAVLVKPKIER